MLRAGVSDMKIASGETCLADNHLAIQHQALLGESMDVARQSTPGLHAQQDGAAAILGILEQDLVSLIGWGGRIVLNSGLSV